MANPVYFTIEGDYKSIVADTVLDANVDPDLGPVSARVTFTPIVNTGDVLLGVTAEPRPIGFVPAPIVGRIDVDGQVKLRVDVTRDYVAPGDILHFDELADFPASGDTAKIYVDDAHDIDYRWTGQRYVDFDPVRLLAETPLLGLAEGTHLDYLVEFSDVRFNGGPGLISSFVVRAKTSDVTLNLITEGKVPGFPAVGMTFGLLVATPPVSAGSAGVAGQVARDTNFLYVCVAANTWKRVALTTW